MNIEAGFLAFSALFSEVVVENTTTGDQDPGVIPLVVGGAIAVAVIVGIVLLLTRRRDS